MVGANRGPTRVSRLLCTGLVRTLGLGHARRALRRALHLACTLSDLRDVERQLAGLTLSSSAQAPDTAKRHRRLFPSRMPVIRRSGQTQPACDYGRSCISQKCVPDVLGAAPAESAPW